MRIVILGANSFLARNLIFELRNHSSFELDLFGMEDHHIDGVPNYKKIDFSSKESIAEIDLNCEVIFFFIGKTGIMDGFNHPELFLDVNDRILLSVLDEYKKQNSKGKLVFPSTRLIYDNNNNACEDDSAKEFKSIYAINKYACEQYIQLYSKMFGIRYCILRICVPYGNNVLGEPSYGTIGFMLNQVKEVKSITIFGDGRSRRTITHVSDLSKVMIKAALSPKCDNDIFNVGGEDYSLSEMAELIAAKFSAGVNYVQYPEMAEKTESGDTVFCSAKIDKALGTNLYEHSFKEWVETIE